MLSEGASVTPRSGPLYEGPRKDRSAAIANTALDLRGEQRRQRLLLCACVSSSAAWASLNSWMSVSPRDHESDGGAAVKLPSPSWLEPRPLLSRYRGGNGSG
jgi:hypothetical protein